MPNKNIIVIENLASFEKLINRDSKSYDINMMVMPGTLEDKHKNVDPKKGIQALRRQFNLIYLLVSGEHDVQLGATYTWLKPNDLVIVPENMVYASAHINKCVGYCIHFKTEFIQPILSEPFKTTYPYFDLEAEHIINIDEESSRIVQKAFRDIIREHERFSPERDFLLRNFINILLLRVREICRTHTKEKVEKFTHTMKLANRFKHLLERDFIEMREVKLYAQKLSISPKYLSDVVKKTFGKSPRQMINDVLLLESKMLLGSTDLSISEISYKLKFDDPAHFSHFIHHHLGCSPRALRKQL
ncbi:MAG TPA: helix-turn-helix domain-containing protein [Aequorivita sp.]|nr:helix-turn-helix domain-containing protein [Aequorivita sp.]